MHEMLTLKMVIVNSLILITGIGFGLALYRLYMARQKQVGEDILNNYMKDAERQKKEKLYAFKIEMQKKRTHFENDLKEREDQLQRQETKTHQREKSLSREEHRIKNLEIRLGNKEKKMNELEEHLYEKHKKADTFIDKQIENLEKVSSLSVEEAKKQLLNKLENRVKLEAVNLVKDIKAEAKERANRDAKEIIAVAIENLAYEFTMESALGSVELPNERFKGMIIGKEGRNIRAFEEATGVKVIIDDTPELIVLSGYDPVAREVARVSMQNLIKSKSININNIQHNVKRATNEVRKAILRAADETLKELKIGEVHPLMRENLGRLKYRYSYGQNMLQHSKEVAFLAGSMAAELGFNVKLARRAGLFHDIGKAISNNSEGSHVTLGVELAEKCREHEVVINSILAHHEEAEPISPLSVLVTAADRISGGRPGARRDTLEAYTKRINKLEEIANSFDGVNKTYAISAGREIRVIVEPDKIHDEQAELLSHDISVKIRDSMEFPGQIKVCVIRQTIASKYTDEYDETISLDDNR
jgi:ribonuclease Y